MRALVGDDLGLAFVRPRVLVRFPRLGGMTTYGRQQVLCIESALHTPHIPVSMLALGFEVGGVMNLHVEDGVSERAPVA